MNVGKTACLISFIGTVTLCAAADHNKAVYGFCVRHQGQQVGDGVCQTLVDAALRSAGLSPRRIGREIWRIASTPQGVVISGDYRKVLPGDIILFHDIDPERQFHRGSEDHSAPKGSHVGVVDSLDLDRVVYFNQNSGHQKTVRCDGFSFSENIDLVGYVAVYRPGS